MYQSSQVVAIAFASVAYVAYVAAPLSVERTEDADAPLRGFIGMSIGAATLGRPTLLNQLLLMTTHLLSFNTYGRDISDKSDEST